MVKRITMEQREAMLQFMVEHPDFSENKFTGPEGAKTRERLWERLASTLNSFSNGATKSTDRWNRSWQDWKCDVKAKGLTIQNHMRQTGGGAPCQLKLSLLEERLLAHIGVECVQGIGVPDPLLMELQLEMPLEAEATPEAEAIPEAEATPEAEASTSTGGPPRKRRKELAGDTDSTAALSLADSWKRIATSSEIIANAIKSIAEAYVASVGGNVTSQSEDNATSSP